MGLRHFIRRHRIPRGDLRSSSKTRQAWFHQCRSFPKIHDREPDVMPIFKCSGTAECQGKLTQAHGPHFRKRIRVRNLIRFGLSLSVSKMRCKFRMLTTAVDRGWDKLENLLAWDLKKGNTMRRRTEDRFFSQPS